MNTTLTLVRELGRIAARARSATPTASAPPAARAAFACAILALATMTGCDAGAQATGPSGGAASQASSTTVSSPAGSGTVGATYAANTPANSTQPTPVAVTTVAPQTAGPGPNDQAFDAASAAGAPIFTQTPDVALSAYTRFRIEPVSIHLAGTSAPSGLSTDEIARIADTLSGALNDTLGESMSPTQGTGPDVALVRCTIARLAPRVDPTSPAGLSGVVFTRAACRIELADSVTGKPLATFADTSTPDRVLMGSPKTDSELAQTCLRQWAEQLAQRLDQARSR